MPKKKFSIFNFQFSAGFTLIELLVVITIIAILTSIGFVSYIDFSKRGRDAKRQSDMATVQSAMQQYNSDTGYYPLNGVNCSNGTYKIDCSLVSPDGSKTYLTKIPKDPLATQDQYCYSPLPANCDNSAIKCSSYQLNTRLEKPPSGASLYSCNGDSNYNFQATPP